MQPTGQPIRSDGLLEHIVKKSGTPTMGGVLILLGLFSYLFNNVAYFRKYYL